MRFLTDKCNEQNRDKTCNILTQLTMQNNNTINPNNVKLLTDDSAGIDFLTLYAVKKSEEEMSFEAVSKMDTTYIPVPKPIEDLFSFVVPDVKVINLSFLTEDNLTQCKNYENNLSIQCKNENETIHDNDYINIDDGNFWCTIRNERSIHNNEIRFEDILEESSDSNETSVSYINQRITNVEINSNKVSTSDMKEDNEIITDIRTELSTNTLEDLGPTIFENILNESFSSVENDLKEEDVFENILNKSFSSVEDDLENKDDTALRSAESNLSNSFIKNAEEINVSYEANVNTFHNEDNVVKTNLSASMKLAKSDKFANFIDEIQDVDFNSDVDINEFIKCDSSKNKSIYNSKAEESLLSITQAIGEIARVKRNLVISRPSVNKEESINKDSTGWISVNIKNDIKAEKSDLNSRTDITLSNTHCNSAAKSCTVKQDFDLILDDSDEDFMITEDSAKKFNELESCYFRNSSKNLKDDIRCMPSTSRNSVIINGCLDDAPKTLKMKDSYFDNISKNLKPSGISTPKNDRHSKLSLKRNKAQQNSSTINLNFFKAPDKYVNNTAEKNILKSDPDTPKQIFLLNEKIAKKNKRRLKCENNVKNEFIDDEAEVDSDVSSDEIVTDEDFGDFVSYTQFSQEQVDMHAHYLQTVKSPIKKPGAFHFREPRSPDLNTEIYSQFSSQIQNSYLYVRILSYYKLYL